jgi:prepilin-type N-terminal cleavage/methylation domain-containing protein
MMGKGQVRMHGRLSCGRSTSDTEAGFSLIEVMIALAVLSIGLLAIFSMQFSAIKTNAVGRGVTENVTVATGKVEQLMSLAYEHPDLTAGSHSVSQAVDGIDNNLNGEIDEPGETGYLNVDWQVQDECLGADFPGIKCVQVHVSSNVNGKRVKEIRLDFIKANML